MSSEGTGSRKRRYDDVFADQVGITELDGEESFSFLWIIKNLNALGDEEIQSPTFTGGTPTAHKWQLKATKHVDKSGRPFLGLTLSLVGFGTWYQALFGGKLKIKYQLSILGGDGFPVEQILLPEAVGLGKNEESGGSLYIPTSIVDSGCALDTVKIHCQVSYYQGTRATIVEKEQQWKY